MRYLLDTNVISEPTRPRPEPRIRQWLDRLDETRVFISVVTMAELRDGVERMTPGKRREMLDEWLTFELATRFSKRILAVDSDIAIECGKVMARQRKAGRTVDVMDSLIAATALQHDLTLATRNISDFENLGLTLINPWEM